MARERWNDQLPEREGAPGAGSSNRGAFVRTAPLRARPRPWRGPRSYPSIARNTPAATALPMTPATLGPMAGMRGFTRQFVSAETNCCTTRALMGTADTPAAPRVDLRPVLNANEEKLEVEVADNDGEIRTAMFATNLVKDRMRLELQPSVALHMPSQKEANPRKPLRRNKSPSGTRA